MSDTKIAVFAVIASILVIALTVIAMNIIYPPWGTVVDTSGMSAEQVELLERWFD